MALVLKDRVKETSTTAGTGTITLAGAVAGFQSFAAVGNGNSTYYAIVDPATGAWEVGIGTYTSSGTTLSRTTVLSSSNSGSLVDFAANSKDVFVTYPSEKSVYEDASNVVNATSFGAITATSAALTTGTITTAPAANTDIVNKTYVDTLVASGIHFHQPVMVESPTNLNATYNNGTAGVGATLTNAGTQVELIIDGIFTSPGDRVLVYTQTNPIENGIYVVTVVGTVSTNWVLTRASDANTYVINSANGLSEGSTVFVQLGATGAGETYTCNTSGVITFGTTAITFAQISSAQIYSAGTGLTLTGTQFSITPTGTAGTYGSASAVPVFVTNAQGQVTSVTNTNIAITGSQVSGNISGSAGSVANALTLGTYLTGTSYNGSAAVTATVDATSANTASKVVARDASGNFSAGTITAALSGNATTATTATNVAGGTANQIVYNTSAGTTNFAAAPSASGQYFSWNGSAYAWVGTIPTTSGGTGLTSFTSGGVVYASSTSALATGSALTFDSTNSRLVVGASGGVSTAYLQANGNGSGTADTRLLLTSTGNGGTGRGTTILFQSAGSSNSVDTVKILGLQESASATANNASFVVQVADTTSGSLTERFRIDKSGNLGLGVTPSAWTTFKVLQIGTRSSLASEGTVTDLNLNVYYDGSYRYIATAAASQYRQQSGNHYWYNAASGTAGNVITLNQAMNLDTSSNLLLGLTGGGGKSIAINSDLSTTGAFLYNDTGQTILSACAAVPMIFRTSNSERFRIGSAGQLGIGGANYGTSGQVLTSNGSGAAPSWQTSAAAAKGFAVGMSLVFGR
jgi:hypothetical protein